MRTIGMGFTGGEATDVHRRSPSWGLDHLAIQQWELCRNAYELVEVLLSLDVVHCSRGI